jgi:signal transduction histidine kinase
MLSPLATLLVTWAAIYAYVSVYYVMLHVRRPRHREYLTFALLCLGMSAWTMGAAIGMSAETVERAELGLQLQISGGFATVAFFVHFASLLVSTRAPRVVAAAYVYALIAIVLDTVGLSFDRDRLGVVTDWSSDVQRRALEPAFSPLGGALVLGSLGFAAWAVWTMARATREHRDLRPLAWMAGLAVLAAANDGIERATHVGSVHLLDHVGLIPVLGVSYLLLRRFVRSADTLGERTDELRQSYSELRVAQEELVRKEQLAAVGELSAVIAHEVRNPLAIIKNAVSSLRRPTLKAEDRRVLLGILDEEVDRLNRLVRDLLAYARPVEPKGRPIDLEALVKAAIDASLEHCEHADRIELVLDADRLPVVQGDPDLLRQALRNVVDNALQAMPRGGKLTVRARARRAPVPGVVLEFEDTGLGMEESVLEKATNPFFTTRPAGTGLGLTIVQSVIKNHGGSVQLRSERDRGTTVTITLPQQRPSSVPPPPEDL